MMSPGTIKTKYFTFDPSRGNHELLIFGPANSKIRS